MEFKIRFRFNKVTGEVELFEVDDVGPMRLPEDEHNREHDQIAAQVGTVIERNPRIDEILPGSAQETTPPIDTPEGEAQPETERVRAKQDQSG